jgi:Transposase DDE domain group 1
MDDDTTEPFGFPAVGRKKATAAFDGGRLTSWRVLLLGAAERQLGLCDRLAALIADPRDPSRVIHPLADILRARSWQLPAAMRMLTTSNTCAGIPGLSWPVVACRRPGVTCARSRPCRAGRTRPACAR